jgi:hypothetical protein
VTIKKLVVGSMFSMLLGSEMAAADWGDVYYCQMTNRIEISLNGKMKTINPETFTFKLDQVRNAVVYGDKKGFFKDQVDKLTEGKAWPEQETWQAQNTYSIAQFIRGKFLFSNVASEVTAITAACEKF